MTNSEEPEQSVLGLHSFVSPMSPNTQIFTVDNIITLCKIFRESNILTWSLKVKKTLSAFLEFCSNWLRLITLCENITLF